MSKPSNFRNFIVVMTRASWVSLTFTVYTSSSSPISGVPGGIEIGERKVDKSFKRSISLLGELKPLILCVLKFATFMPTLYR